MDNRLFFYCILLLFFSNSIISQSPCNNGGFENNNLSNWTTYTGVNVAGVVDLGAVTMEEVTGRHTVVEAGLDPILFSLGVNLPMVDEGSYSLRLGNNNVESEADLAKYTFNVNSSNANFSFRYSMVLEDPNSGALANEHEANEKPFFSYVIYTGSGFPNFSPFGNNVIDMSQWVSDVNDPFFAEIGVLAYRDWSTVCIDLSNYIGQEVSILFVTADCSLSGHYGYAYIDGLCSNNDPVPLFDIDSEYCVNHPVIADASASLREDNYFWSIQESLSDWTPVGVEYSAWFEAEQAGIIDLKSFLEGKGGNFECDKYYRIKLAVGNECNPWVSVTKLIRIRCVEIGNFQDMFFCCGETPKVNLKPPRSNLNYTYNWSSFPNIPIYSNAQGNGITIYPTESTTIIVNASDNQYNCDNDTEEVNIWFVDEISVRIIEENEGCCNKRLTAVIDIKDDDCNLSQNQKDKIRDQISIKWNTGETSESIIIADTVLREYSVALEGIHFKSDCYINADTIMTNVDAGKYMNTTIYSKQLIAPNTVTPTEEGGLNDTLKILEFGPSAPYEGEPNAYGIIGYHLTIYSREGQLIRDILVEDCNIHQGDIRWDCRNNSGHLVMGGVYVFRLEMKTCNGWHPVCSIITNGIFGETEMEDATNLCIDGYVSPFTWPPFSLVCTDYLSPGVGDIGEDVTCIFSVTVSR
ncbi:MAG: hypothetical protein N4A35_01835 [Flavobacteriales bacterium]|jgi:hypothetical protein|nr:hypothetical protein [Flavobacteriales bacterium]